MSLTLFLAFLGVVQHTYAHCSKNYTFDTIAPSKHLTWFPCNVDFFCAQLEVPLDYESPNLGQASVPLLKYAAKANSTYGPYQGMILINPGGPGASGVQEALAYASAIQAVVGSNWDVVGFDPRGMYLSKPVANCSVDKSVQTGKLINRQVPRAADNYYNLFIDFGQELGKDCEMKTGGEQDAGPHMSTATTARDMISIVDAFADTEEGQTAARPSNLLNYYGISYGTFLGQTFASMFPDRVGRVVLDGVVHPEGYLANYTYQSVTHLDGVVAAFFIYCYEAGVSQCSFYTGSSPKDIYDRFNESFVQLDAQKAAAENWSNATEIDTALVVLKVALLTTADTPLSYFSILPDMLLGLENALATQNISAWIAQAETIYGDPMLAGYENPQWTLGVLCSDMENRWYDKTLEDLRPLLAVLEQSSIVGDIWIKSMLGCTGWSIEATETFQGPFGGDTANPILFVGNTYDPVTPFDNAIWSAPKYSNAQALIVDGMGHTTMAAQNLCAYQKIATYFQTGDLPGNGFFCAFEAGVLGITLNGTLEETIAKAGLSNLVQYGAIGNQVVETIELI